MITNLLRFTFPKYRFPIRKENVSTKILYQIYFQPKPRLSILASYSIQCSGYDDFIRVTFGFNDELSNF